MPGKKKTIVVVGKRQRKPANRFGTSRRGWGRLSIGFPETTTCKLRYCEHYTLNASAGPAGANYGANCLFDPSLDIGGHQPMGFDIWNQVYNRYIVLGSKIRCDFWTEDPSTAYVSVVGIKLEDDTSISPVSSIEGLMEQPSKLFHWKPMRNGSNTGEKTVVKCFHKYSPKKYFGCKDTQDNIDELGALVSANPTQLAVYKILVGHPDGATDIPTIHYMVTIDYTVQFDKLKDLAQS